MSGIALLGSGAVTGFGVGVPALAAGLREGRGAIRPLVDGEWPGLARPRFAAMVPNLDETALADRVAEALPAVADRLGRTLRAARRSLGLGLLAAAEALAGGGGDGAPDADLALVVAGSNLFAGALAEAEARRLAGGRPGARHGVEMFDTHAVGLLSEALGCRGPGLTVGGASASGTVAIVTAIDLLRVGRARRCLVVGLPADLGPADWAGLDLIAALADDRSVADGRVCRPFDAAATGFVPGEMAGALLLGADGEALVRLTGSALRLDGSAQPSPSPDGERRVMREALTGAGLGSDDIDLISAHATSTPLGDRTEADAIAELFGDRPVVNAAKGLIGHGLNAAGLVETVAAAVQIENGFVHPNAHLENPVRPLRYAGGRAESRTVRRVLKTGFGFGGFNAALVLEGSA